MDITEDEAVGSDEDWDLEMPPGDGLAALESDLEKIPKGEGTHGEHKEDISKDASKVVSTDAKKGPEDARKDAASSSSEGQKTEGEQTEPEPENKAH